MTSALIRKKLISEIKNAPEKELKEMYKLHQLVVEEKKLSFSWDDLTEQQKNQVEEGIKQLDAGEGIPAEKVAAYLNKKYGITT